MIKTAKAIVANTDLSTAQAFVYTTPNVNFATIISGAGDDVFVKVRQIGADFGTRFFELEGSISERLNESLKLFSSELESVENLQILLISWQDDVLYILSSGKHQAFLLRDQLVSLTSQEEGASSLVSGHIKIGDRLLFITDTLSLHLQTQSQDEFQKQLIKILNTQLETFEEEISSYLPQSEHVDPIAAILIDYHSDQKIESIDQKETQVIPKRQINWLMPNKRLILAILALVLLIGGGFLIFKLVKPTANFQQTSQPENSPQASVNSNILPTSEWKLFLDLGLIKEGFKTSRLSASLNNLLVLDENTSQPNSKKSLSLVNLENKNHQLLAGQDKLGDARLASLNGDFSFIFSDKGVVRVDTKSQKTQVIVKVDDSWGQIKDIVGFASNVYLLDTNNQIWKYVPTESGYSDKIKYLQDQTKVDFSQAIKMQIDSSVWILKQGGIEKYTRGVRDNFVLDGFDEQIKIDNFFVSDQTDSIYLLDKENKRLIVFDKNGQFVKAFADEKFKNVVDLVVGEEVKLVYLLLNEPDSPSKIFQIYY